MRYMKESVKEWVQYIICIVCVMGAMIMSFLAMYIKPEGEIDESILWLIAQVLVFVGSIFGINTVNNINIKKIRNMSKEKNDNME